jgi:hypothetical protein
MDHEELWAEMAVISRRMARIEIALTDRIIALENELGDLKRAREMHHEDAELEIAEIMQR